MSATGTAVLLKFDLFQQGCLGNYIKSAYHSNYTENAKKKLKVDWKVRERKIYHWKKKLSGTIEENARSKFRDPKVKKTVSKKEIPGNPEQKKNVRKGNIMKILNEKENMKKKYEENP